MNEQLFEEINVIKEKLLERNIRMEDLDISSESQISSTFKHLKKSRYSRIPKNPKNKSKITKNQTEVNKQFYNMESQVDIINEEHEEEEKKNRGVNLLSPTS